MLKIVSTTRYEKPAPSAGNFPTPNATLINGLGRAFQGPTSPLAVVNVAENTRYRFRLVSMSCDPNYNFSIDGHTMVRNLSCQIESAIKLNK